MKMAGGITKQQVKALLGQQVVARMKDGSAVSGKLVKIKGGTLVLQGAKEKTGKTVKTKAFLPLVLFDVAAIGAGTGFGPYGYGGYDGYGFGPYGYGGFPGYPGPGFGGPFFF
jgi:small nuclear ribonucleoprotein (snRNP)-like protein